MASNDRTEVLVVGGGLAGCVLAGRLVRAGIEVTVVEAGPDYGPLATGLWPVDLLDASVVPTSHDWGYSGSGAGGQKLSFERCRAIGGCSSHNGTTQNVGWAGDYDSWAEAGSAGWDAASLEPFFRTALSQFEVRRYASEDIQPFHQGVIDAAIARGLPKVDDFVQLDGRAGVGCSPVNATTDGIRINARFAYLDSLNGAPNLRVLDRHVARRVVVADGAVIGVDLDGPTGQHFVRAQTVVVCAGTYGTPELLLRSGIGGPEDGAVPGSSFFHMLPGVGQNLHDQPTAQLEFEASDLLTSKISDIARLGTVLEEQTIIKVRSPFAGDAPFDVHIYPWIEPYAAAKSGWKCVIPVGLLRPFSRGSVQLNTQNPTGNAEIRTGFLDDPRDLRTLEFGTNFALDLVREPSLAQFLGAPLSIPDLDVQGWIRARHTHYWHPVGTCKMGPASDPGAVVDHRGRVHGLDGLFVADASIFPDTPRGTIALPTAVVAERVAAFLMEDRLEE